MKRLILFVTFGAYISALGEDIKDYHLNLETAWSLKGLPLTIPVPNRVEVYRSQVTKGYDKTPISNWISKPPVYVTTNYSDITNLISVMRTDVYPKIVTNAANQFGITDHFLFFFNGDKTFIHYRVVEFTNLNTALCEVHPQSTTGSFWFNKEIGIWLHKKIADKP